MKSTVLPMSCGLDMVTYWTLVVLKVYYDYSVSGLPLWDFYAFLQYSSTVMSSASEEIGIMYMYMFSVRCCGEVHFQRSKTP